jgi:tetratricopeptide (TPR) repeat protein
MNLTPRLAALLLLAATQPLLLSAPPRPDYAPSAGEAAVAEPLQPAAEAERETEVQKPEAFSIRDQRVMQEAARLPTGRIMKLLQVYERQGNTSMVDGLSRIVLQRDPNNAEALRMLDSTNPKEEVRAVGYMELLAQKVMAGEKVEDVDSVIIHANALLTEYRAADAVELLQQLRLNQFGKDFFPALDDLAFAYSEVGQYDDAERLYKEVAADSRFPILDRKEAEAILPTLATKKRIASIRLACGTDYELLLQKAIALQQELPADHDALTFRIEALDRLHRYDDVVAMMRIMRSQAGEVAAWPWEPTLAYAQYGARRFDEAIATFQGIQKNEGFDAQTRMEAENMILEIQVQKEVEKGVFALQNIDFTAARETLTKLEANYSQHQDTLGYKAIYMAKTGQSDAALNLLFAKKREVEAQGLPFSQQDALSDVFYERKQFDLARISTQQILADPRYDDRAKEAAVKQLRNIIVGMFLNDGDRALQEGDRHKAKLCLQRAQQVDADGLDVRIFQAEVALAYSRNAEARDELLGLQAVWKEGPFPGQLALADAYASAGDWEKADQTYALVMNSPGVSSQDYWDAQWQRRFLMPWHQRHSSYMGTYTHSDEGSIYTGRSRAWTAWNNDNWRFGAFLTSDFINTSKSSVIGARSAQRFEGGVVAQKRWGDGYFAEAYVGGSKADVVYGAKVGKLGYQSLGWSLAWEGNGRNNESLAMAAMNARQDLLTLSIQGPVWNRFLLDFNTYYQTSRIGSEKLAEGYGVTLGLDFVLQTETKRRPQITIGYNGEYHRQSVVSSLPPRIREEIRRAGTPPQRRAGEEVRRAVAADFGREMINNLIDPETHRHGLELRFSKNFDDISAYVMVGTYYSVDDDLVGIVAGAGVEYWLSERTMLYAQLRVDTSGQAANTGGLVYEATIGGMRQF